ncbi:MAG: 3-oxoacyl-[acyl-carrier-protein] reductase [Sphingomonadales bacterium]
MFDLSGKCALVTGASGGVGRAIAKSLHERGAAVALSGTRVGVLEEVAADVGERTFIVPCNLSDRVAVAALVGDAEKAMGQVDILINNAGLTRDGLALRMKADDWDQVIEVNLSASFSLSRAVMRGMMKRRWGRVINITSVVGVTGNPGQANYAASKAGIIGMTKSLAAETASRGITFNCVAPGFIVSPMTDVLDEKQRENILLKIPAGKLGKAADIGASVAFLASNEAGYITGQTLHVNGGMAMI